MNKFKSLLIIIGLLSSSILAHAEDYAIINTYPLLNDMKTLNKQETILTTISQMFEMEKVDNQVYQDFKVKFVKVLSGLEEGDTHLKLKGTNIPTLRNKIVTIKKLWKTNQTTVNQGLNSKTDKQNALNLLNTLSIELKELASLYQKSYSRYKQRSIIGSIVKCHMYKKETLQQQRLVLNTVQ